MLTETSARGARFTAPADGRWCSRAFGLNLRGEFETLAFDLAAKPVGGSWVDLEIVSEDELDRAWAPRDPVRRGEAKWDDGTPFITVDGDPDLGYRVWAQGAGRYRVDPSARRVICAPGELPMWRWQRFLIGQVLPLAAAVHGYEVLHASAVCLHGRAVALLGDTGAGKTSLAANLVMNGADFLADDALALERRADRVVAHPGPPIAGVRHAELARLSDTAQRSLGTVVGRNEKELLFRMRRYGGAAAVAALYFIDRGSATTSVGFAPVTDPRLLISSTFNFIHRPPQRLAELLDICARIDATAGIFRVSSPPEMGAAALAREIAYHVETLA